MTVRKFEERPERFNEYINHEGKTVRIDPTKAHNLLCLLEAAKATNGDILLIYDGEEGSGKSTEARQDLKFLDPTFDESRIEFNPEDAIKAHFRGLPENWDPAAYNRGEYNNKPWQAIMLDESAKLDRKRTMSTNSVEFTGFQTQSRQLHKIFAVVLPNVHMLDGYIAEHRAVALINSYKHEKEHMGFYKWFTRKHLRVMFSSDMHKRKMYPRDCAFMGRFSGIDPFDLTRYERKKAAALNAYRRAEGLGGPDIPTPEEVTRGIELAALKRAVEQNLIESHVFRALNIGRRTWQERKKALIASGEIKITQKSGVANRLKDALNASSRANSEDEHGA